VATLTEQLASALAMKDAEDEGARAESFASVNSSSVNSVYADSNDLGQNY